MVRPGLFSALGVSHRRVRETDTAACSPRYDPSPPAQEAKLKRSPDHSSRLARGELADEDAAERLGSLDPEALLRRREFLGRTAALAGLAGAASLLPAETLVAEAAKVQARRRFPAPRDLPIDTFVVLMMENRSFDHFFGWYPRADGKNAGLAYPDGLGGMVATHHLTGDYQGCEFRDPDHSWSGGRFQWGRGKMNGFVMGNRDGTGSDAFAVSYYLEDDLPFLPDAARAFTLYDRWFTSLMASTFPNRHYQMSAQSGGTISNDLPPPAGYPLGYTWETIFDRALAHGVSVGYYVSDLPAPGLYGERAKAWTRPAAQFYADAAAGNLPAVCFIDPPFGDIGTLGGGASDHPHSDIRLGQAFMSDVVHAFIESPQYQRGALFINYDEWGGFFDHVEPVFVPDQRSSRKLGENFGLTGFRVPTVAVSPYAVGGRVNHMTATHESILKLISYRYRLGHLNVRHRYASNIGRSFNFERPVFDPPSLPDPVAILATPCPVSELGGPASAPAPHDLMRLQTSGYLERIGFPTYEATPANIFRNPDSVVRALRESG